MKVTTDHQEIMIWAQTNKGQPEIAQDPEASAQPPILRIHFPVATEENYFREGTQVKKISWNEFFEKFEEFELAFIYNEAIKEYIRDLSNEYQFIKRDQLEENKEKNITASYL